MNPTRLDSVRAGVARPLAVIALVCAVFVIPAASQAAKPLANAKLTIAAAPNPVTVGKPIAITGKLTGAQNAGQGVMLQVNAYPYAGYVNGAVTTTDANGNYTLTATPLVNTRYQVQTTTVTPAETSGEVTVSAAASVRFGLSDRTPRAGQLVRFYGTVTPANDGASIQIQRLTSTGAWKTVARTYLKDDGAARSKYSRRIRVRRSGSYRVVAPATVSNAEGISATRSARVH